MMAYPHHPDPAFILGHTMPLLKGARHQEASWRVSADACWAFPLRARERADGVVLVCQACRADTMLGDRRHYYWDCVVACGLRESMGMAMGAHPEDSLGVCARSYLWLVPAGAGQYGMWYCVGGDLLRTRSFHGQAVVRCLRQLRGVCCGSVRM